MQNNCARALPALFAQVGMKLLNWTDDCDAYLTRCELVEWLLGGGLPLMRKASLEVYRGRMANALCGLTSRRCLM